MKAGTESVTTSDILYLLGQRAGGNEAVAGMIVSGMSAEEKQSFVREIGDLLLVFQAAQLKGIHLEPALAAKVRWDTVNTIAQAYVEREASGWDLAKKALKAYFRPRADYAVKEAFLSGTSVRVRARPGRECSRSSPARFCRIDQESRRTRLRRKRRRLGWIEKATPVRLARGGLPRPPKGGSCGRKDGNTAGT